MTIFKKPHPKERTRFISTTVLCLKCIHSVNKFTTCALFIEVMGHLFKKWSHIPPEQYDQPTAIRMQNKQHLLRR